ncbi:hypothetical protein [Jeotgalibaca porci]|uniref:hypothetical protein n=1 Tax=Jeotgalibaca porci TaxID=1868793 RepID=UPI00359F85CC
MELTEVVVSLVVPILTGLVSYFAAKNQSKIEIEKVKVQSDNDLKAIKEKYTHDLEMLRTQTSSEIEKLKATKELDLQFSEKEIINDMTKTMITNMLNSNPEEAIKSVESLMSVGEIMKNINK